MVDLSKLVKTKTESELKDEAEKLSAISYLKETDWYVIRKLESGTEIPEDVAKARQEARSKV